MRPMTVARSGFGKLFTARSPAFRGNRSNGSRADTAFSVAQHNLDIHLIFRELDGVVDDTTSSAGCE